MYESVPIFSGVFRNCTEFGRYLYYFCTILILFFFLMFFSLQSTKTRLFDIKNSNAIIVKPGRAWAESREENGCIDNARLLSYISYSNQ